VEAVPLLVETDPDEPDFASVMIDATVVGRRYRLMLDTGAARTHLDADEYIKSLPVVGEHASAGSFGRLVTYPVVRIPCLTAGALDVGALDVTTSEHQAGPGGVLGMDVLGRRRCHFRVDFGVLELDALPERPLDHQLLTGSRGHVYVDVSWPGVTARACWDTGAGATLVSEAFWHAYPQLFSRVGTVNGTDASGDHMETPQLLMAGPVIGAQPFAKHKVVAVNLSGMNDTSDRPADLVLGYPTIRQADWLFDFPARRWTITRMTSKSVAGRQSAAVS